MPAACDWNGSYQAQKKPPPVEEDAEIIFSGGKPEINGVALASGEVIAVHAVAVLYLPMTEPMAEQRRIPCFVVAVKGRI